MLRSVKSTQRKMRQLELNLEVKSITISGTPTDVVVVKGPAKRQVVTVDRRDEDDAASPDQDLQFALSGPAAPGIDIQLKQPFTEQDPVVLVSSNAAEDVKNQIGSGASDSLIAASKQSAFAAGDKVSMLIIGSDTEETY